MIFKTLSSNRCTLKNLIAHIGHINFAVYICQIKNLLEVKASKIKKINLSLWRRILIVPEHPKQIPSLFSCLAYTFFSFNPQQLLLSNLRHLVNFSPSRYFFPLSELSCPTCILGNDASSPKICLVYLSIFNTPWFLLFFSFFCLSSESLLPLSSLSLSSASKAACPSSIRLHALPRNHESHSHFHCAGAAKIRGQGREVALASFIWWGAGEAFVFLCTFSLAASLTLSIRLTCTVTLFHQEKFNIRRINCINLLLTYFVSLIIISKIYNNKYNK